MVLKEKVDINAYKHTSAQVRSGLLLSIRRRNAAQLSSALIV